MSAFIIAFSAFWYSDIFVSKPKSFAEWSSLISLKPSRDQSSTGKSSLSIYQFLSSFCAEFLTCSCFRILKHLQSYELWHCFLEKPNYMPFTLHLCKVSTVRVFLSFSVKSILIISHGVIHWRHWKMTKEDKLLKLCFEVLQENPQATQSCD